MEVQTEKALITVPDAARFLSVSVRKLWAMRDAGMLPGVVNIGRSVRVRRDLLEAWIAENCPDIRRTPKAR